jgi:signal peptidase I
VLDGRARWIVKRAAAVPGDPGPRESVPALRSAAEQRVPPRRLVVLGDRPDRSYDSRQYGYLAADRIMGVVVRPLRDPPGME